MEPSYFDFTTCPTPYFHFLPFTSNFETMTRTKKAAVEKKLAAKTAVLKKGVRVGSDSHIYFGSGSKAPFNKLSNFSKCNITGKMWIFKGFNEYVLKEFVFPSSEHMWWAHFFVVERDVRRLAIGGDLSTLQGLEHFYEGEDLEKKISYWSRKDNVGIVAKLLAGKKGTNYRKRASDIGMCMTIHPCERYGPQGEDSTLWKIWKRILLAKYTQNRGHYSVLMGTKSKKLVEFTRAPMIRIEKEFWAGRVVDSNLYGGNYMGDCMVRIRDHLLG